jgi:hypothetical protein
MAILMDMDMDMDMEESELPQLFLFLPAAARRESSDGFTDMCIVSPTMGTLSAATPS